METRANNSRGVIEIVSLTVTFPNLKYSGFKRSLAAGKFDEKIENRFELFKNYFVNLFTRGIG